MAPHLPLEADEITRHVGRRLRQRRQVMGLKPGELDRLAGFPAGAVRRMEAGDKAMSVGQVFEIARNLDVKVAYFFQGLPGDNQPAGVSPDRKTERLLRAFAAIPNSRVRQTLYDLLISMETELENGDTG